MTPAQAKNGGAMARAKYGAIGTGTAGGTGDNTAITAGWIDRSAGGALGMAQSCKVIVAYKAALSANKSLKLAFKMQDADDGSGTNAADLNVKAYPGGAAYASTAVATDGGSGSTMTGVAEFDVDLSSAKQYVAGIVTPDLDASGTDTFTVAIVAVLFGSDRGPISASLV